MKSQIAALQTEVSNGNWVTSLTPTDGGFTVTFKDGKTYTIVNGKDGDKGETGEAGKDGNSVEVKDGYWYINGEKTDYVAVIKEDLGKDPCSLCGKWCLGILRQRRKSCSFYL